MLRGVFDLWGRYDPKSRTPPLLIDRGWLIDRGVLSGRLPYPANRARRGAAAGGVAAAHVRLSAASWPRYPANGARRGGGVAAAHVRLSAASWPRYPANRARRG